MRYSYCFVASLFLSALAATGCSDSGGDATPGGSGGSGGAGGCNPDQATFDASIAAIIDRKCSQCHGDVTNHGAPFSLTQYAPLVSGTPGSRIVDRMSTAVQQFKMPPPGNPQLTQTELETLLGWASCGTAHADYSRGLTANREVWTAPADPSPGLQRIPLTANEFAVPNERSEWYRSFRFQNLVDHDVFIRRMDAVIDESRVVHHVTLHYTSDDSYLYAWAPGTGAVEFPDGGLRLTPGDGFRVEIHYNNLAGLTDVKDSSGIALYVSEPSGTEYGMMDPTNFAISVPPKSTQTVTRECTATQDYQILAGMPHMHQIGKSFEHVVQRKNGGAVDSIIKLDGWSFALQYYYKMGVTIHAGDVLKLSCTYANPTDQKVTGGTNTTNEMCYDFMYVTPASARNECPGFF